MELEITVISGQAGDDLVSLSQWLRQERDLASAVTVIRSEPGVEELGGALEMISVALGSGGAFAVLAPSLEAWFRNRRAKIKIQQGERSIEVDASSAKNLSDLLKVLIDGQGGSGQ